ncbi:MAG: HD domain-containing protein [Candidatus Omnitrophica bacterium]|nr:HD domain-containing protein [Candidatus Omnitrophota bacterium]MDD5429292.1 HD domain-containing protein [Candidatus Omnitrophota bacterium]
MIRISDIVKMSGDRKNPENESKILVENMQMHKIISLAQEEGHKIEDSNLYSEGISLITGVLSKIANDEAASSVEVVNFSKSLVETILINENEYFLQFYRDSYQGSYLPYHSLNVGLMATKIGIWAGLNKSELMELAVSGFLHDLGMVKVENIVNKKDKLIGEEIKLVEKHSWYSAQILKKMGCLSDEGVLAVETHHHRGPRDKISEILSLADIYEAITHSRAYKKHKAPHQAISEIIDQEALGFQPSIMKAFVNNIGIYPVGSWVKLSTGEIGLVTGMNKGHPLRPKVNIIFNHMGERLTCSKSLDFMTETYFYIDQPLDVSDLEKMKFSWKSKDKDTLS